MIPPIRLRPHHLFCALGYQGEGYSDEFTANMTRIVVGKLRAPGGLTREIEIAPLADDLCTPCPKRRGAQCTGQAKISRLDHAHAEALGLRPGDRLTWDTALRLMAAQPLGIHKQICGDCQWMELGYCEAAHKELKDTQRSRFST